jgi:hypothetical protein
VLSGFDRLEAIASEHGICVVVMTHTRLESLNFLHPYHVFYEAIATAAEERGFHAVSSYPPFSGMAAKRLWITKFDAHPNGEGHALLAQVALEELARIPESCWEGSRSVSRFSGRRAETKSGQ